MKKLLLTVCAAIAALQLLADPIATESAVTVDTKAPAATLKTDAPVGCGATCPISAQGDKALDASKCATCPVGMQDDKAMNAPKCAACPIDMQATTIDTTNLKALIASGHPIVILDARAKGSFTEAIPGAKVVGVAPTAEEIAAAAPSKDALVVTYCGGVKCPLSGKLATSLRSQGYTHVLEYHEGIAGWLAAADKPAAK